MRIAFLADIHGNLPALEAVIADFANTSPDAVYLVGDQINRLPWSNEVMDLIADKGWQGIRGNHEIVVSHIADQHTPHKFEDQARFADLWWTARELRYEHLQSIQSLPDEVSLDFGENGAIRLVHGIPGDPFRGLLPGTDAEIVCDQFGKVQEAVVVCGHTHKPLLRSVGRWRMLNGGSVGNPYNGDPRAQYLLLTSNSSGWTPIFRRIEYPIRHIREAFIRHKLLVEYGPMAEIHLRAVEEAQPWVSDFGYWLNNKRPDMKTDLARAVQEYESLHGPGRWCFQET